MNNKYQQYMENIYVTDELKTRITDCISSTTVDTNDTFLWKMNWQKTLRVSFAVLAMFAIGLYTHWNMSQRGNLVTTPPPESQTLVEYDSIQDIEQEIGYSFIIPKDIPFSVKETAYYIDDQRIVSIKYESGDQVLWYSTAISRYFSTDSIVLENPRVIEENGISIYVGSNDSNEMLVMWTSNGFTHFVQNNVFKSTEAVMEFVKKINEQYK